jgi:hypothetical protein
MGEKRTVNYTLMGLMGQTVDVKALELDLETLAAHPAELMPTLRKTRVLSYSRRAYSARWRATR